LRPTLVELHDGTLASLSISKECVLFTFNGLSGFFRAGGDDVFDVRDCRGTLALSHVAFLDLHSEDQDGFKVSDAELTVDGKRTELSETALSSGACQFQLQTCDGGRVVVHCREVA
jgi:hypothetical protein